ncbi:MAG: aspartate aminotransferase family protein [Alphaproteobacteria bacterium]|nr:aspartate aminotransferase family protein [Alphaproteobacteria bacterium]
MNDGQPTESDLKKALNYLLEWCAKQHFDNTSTQLNVLPDTGLGQAEAARLTANLSLNRAQSFHSAGWFAHMDPPTPWVTWTTQAFTAAMNQNLLHPDTGEIGRQVEADVVAALAPHFGMDGGHMVPGSTLANLTAIWAAREVAGAREVVASELAHLSVAKAAHVLGLPYRAVPCDGAGHIEADQLGNLEGACLVLTAGATSTGSVDPMTPMPKAAWVHVDAAWAGPLRLSPTHRSKLAGLDAAQSVAVSAHKWLWQPKDSALILFSDSTAAHQALSFGGAYLAAPNIGVMGSSAARAIPLAATLMAFGLEGIAERLDACMALASRFAGHLEADSRFELWAPPETGVIAWRPVGGSVPDLRAKLAAQGYFVSQTKLDGEDWLRSVAIHPGIDVDAVYHAARS